MFARDLLGSSTGGIPTTHQYTSGSGMETIPAGATTLVIEVWGGAGGGSNGWGSGSSSYGGSGGGAPGYSKTSLSVTGDAGKTFNYSVGAGGAANANGADSTVSAGTQALTTLTAQAGQGSVANFFSDPSEGQFYYYAIPGNGGTAVGGTVTNTSGNNGVYGSGAGPGTGGAATAGTNATGPAGGIGGYGYGTPGTPGGNGLIVFSYT